MAYFAQERKKWRGKPGSREMTNADMISESHLRNRRAAIGRHVQLAWRLFRSLVDDRAGRKRHRDGSRQLPAAKVDRLGVGVPDDHRAKVFVVLGREGVLQVGDRALRVRNAGALAERVADALRRVVNGVRRIEMHATRHNVVLPNVLITIGRIVRLDAPVRHHRRTPAVDPVAGLVTARRAEIAPDAAVLDRFRLDLVCMHFRA